MSWEGVFVNCFDGDTLDVKTSKGDRVRVRLWGIDAPEHGQPGFRSSKAYLRGLCKGRRLIVRPCGMDLYGRTIAKIEVQGGGDVSEMMLASGWAWWYRQFCRKELHLARIEWQARCARVGIWAQDNPAPPWAWRRCGKFAVRPSRNRSGLGIFL